MKRVCSSWNRYRCRSIRISFAAASPDSAASAIRASSHSRRRRVALIAREAKGIRTSAQVWYKGSSSDVVHGLKLVNTAIRVQDPTVRFHGHWVVRRLAPDCSRIELSSLAVLKDESQLLYDMGWEAANMHFGSPRAIPRIKKDLAARKGRWLHKSAKAMLKLTNEDWEEWRRHWKNQSPPVPLR